jgi:hypothetical protein
MRSAIVERNRPPPSGYDLASRGWLGVTGGSAERCPVAGDFFLRTCEHDDDAVPKEPIGSRLWGHDFSETQ